MRLPRRNAVGALLLCCAPWPELNGEELFNFPDSDLVGNDRPVFNARNLTFSVIDSVWGDNTCCRTIFFDIVLEALRKHPAFRSDPREADVLIPAIDTLRQCWSLKSTTIASCTDGGTGPACSWCCPQGVQEFTDTIMESASRYGLGKRYVYFKNTQDTAKDCNEFLFAKVSFAKLRVAVDFVGFNLEASQLTNPVNVEDINNYPIPGINLLVPLHYSFPDDFPLSDTSRDSCDEINNRILRASFSGHTDYGVREKLFAMEVPENFFVRSTDHFGAGNDEMDYMEMLRSSVFAYAPRGDEHYSFRLTEILAAGAVPVIIDDEYTPPYGMPDLKDWALRVPENNVSSSVDIIKAVSREEVCRLRRNGAKIFRYSKDQDGLATGLVEAFGSIWERRGILSGS